MRHYYKQKETLKDNLSKKLDTSYLSLNSDYGRFVSQYLKYPTLKELIYMFIEEILLLEEI